MWMRQAINLARNGYPAPNPHVGCVIVRDEKVVGEGFHAYAGGPHAEAVALAAAGPLARGACAYVTLEPCNHEGRTGPCAQALIAAGVRRVVFGVADPTPKAAGGADALREAGIEVVDGVCAAESAWECKHFLRSIERKRPWVVLKAAITRDGFLARTDGTSKWISNDQSRMIAHEMRAELGAVLVGSGTVLQDNPLLTARVSGVVNQPVRIVLDSRGALGKQHQVFDDSALTWRVGLDDGADIVALEKDGRVDLGWLMVELRNRGITGLLVEGGAKLHAAFLEANLVDQIELFVAPTKFGAGLLWQPEATEDRLWPFAFRVRRGTRVIDDLWLTLEKEIPS